jgi:hypothetical protein
VSNIWAPHIVAKASHLKRDGVGGASLQLLHLRSNVGRLLLQIVQVFSKGIDCRDSTDDSVSLQLHTALQVEASV